MAVRRAWRRLRWEPATLTVTPATADLAPLGTQQLSAALTTGDGLAYLGPQSAVEYATSDAGVATVSGAGLITAVADGEATITATVTQYRTVTDTVAVTVVTP